MFEPRNLEKTLKQLDPFEESIHKDNCVIGRQVDDVLESEIRLQISSSNLKGSRLAEMLSDNDPFEVVSAMKKIGTLYKKSTAHIRENENIFADSRCGGECCLGCSFCDGMECIEDIRNDECVDFGDDEEAFFPDANEAFAIESDDDEKLEDLYNTTANDGNTIEEYQSKSFWDHRKELALVLDAEKKQKELYNSSCRSCYSPTHCSECNTTEFLSAKKNATFIKEFAMRTTLMELGVKI